MKRSWLLPILGSCLSISAFGMGCSFINSFDELEPGNAAGNSAGGANAGGSSAGSAGTGGAAGSGGAGGSGGDAQTQLPEGLIVVVGDGALEQGGRGVVLSALSPYSGEEYDRLSFSAGIHIEAHYDAGAKVWYLFEQLSGALDDFKLRSLSFNRLNSSWETIGELEVPAPNGLVAVLNERLVYQSVAPDGMPSDGFTIVNTSAPAALAIIGPRHDRLVLGGEVSGVSARPFTGRVGGTFSFFYRASDVTCAGDPPTCNLIGRQGVLETGGAVSTTGLTPADFGSVRRTGGGFTGLRAGDEDILVHADSAWDGVGTNEAFVKRIQPSTLASLGELPFEVASHGINAAAWDPCAGQVFITTPNSDPALISVPFSPSAQVNRLSLAQAAHSVRFEQHTQTILLGLNNQIRAFSKKANQAEGLDERFTSSTLAWSPPSDLEPRQLQVEEPVAPLCP